MKLSKNKVKMPLFTFIIAVALFLNTSCGASTNSSDNAKLEEKKKEQALLLKKEEENKAKLENENKKKQEEEKKKQEEEKKKKEVEEKAKKEAEERAKKEEDERKKKEAQNANSNKPKIEIHGNSRSKIYHMPGQASYHRISKKNLVIFHSEEDAIKAGYRKAKR